MARHYRFAPSLSRSEGEGWGGVGFCPCRAEPCSAGALPGKPLPTMARHYRFASSLSRSEGKGGDGAFARNAMPTPSPIRNANQTLQRKRNASSCGERAMMAMASFQWVSSASSSTGGNTGATSLKRNSIPRSGNRWRLIAVSVRAIAQMPDTFFNHVIARIHSKIISPLHVAGPWLGGSAGQSGRVKCWVRLNPDNDQPISAQLCWRRSICADGLSNAPDGLRNALMFGHSRRIWLLYGLVVKNSAPAGVSAAFGLIGNH